MKIRIVHPLKLAVTALIALTALTGCEELEKLIDPNQAPAIDRVFALRNQLFPSDTTTIQVDARDPEGNALTYAWSAPAGTLSSTTGRLVLWTAPALAGDYRISVKVRDDMNGETEGSVTLSVIAFERPTVKITTPANGTFIPGLDEVTIAAEASHPNGIAHVEFRVGQNLLGEDNSPPYQWSWPVEGLSGPATIFVRAFRAVTPGEPGVDSVRVSIEGVTRL